MGTYYEQLRQRVLQELEPIRTEMRRIIRRTDDSRFAIVAAELGTTAASVRLMERLITHYTKRTLPVEHYRRLLEAYRKLPTKS